MKKMFNVSFTIDDTNMALIAELLAKDVTDLRIVQDGVPQPSSAAPAPRRVYKRRHHQHDGKTIEDVTAEFMKAVGPNTAFTKAEYVKALTKAGYNKTRSSPGMTRAIRNKLAVRLGYGKFRTAA